MVLEKTFANDELLPDLPLPSLCETLTRYLDSVKPHVTEEEFLTTKQIVNQFEKNEGSVLHQRLVDRARDHKNWVSIINLIMLRCTLGQKIYYILMFTNIFNVFNNY